MTHVLRAAEISFGSHDADHSEGLERAVLLDRAAGSVHMGFGISRLAPDGHAALHMHSFEESFYVLRGRPALYLDGASYRLLPGACGVVPVGVPHAWVGGEDDGAA